MLLNLSEDQQFFRETTDRFLTEQVPPDTLRGLRYDPIGYDPAYWRRGAELGWTSLLVSEEHGGGTISDSGLADAGLVAYEFGRHAAPGPLAVVNVVAAALSEHDAAPDVLAGLLSGEAIATWCAPPFGSTRWQPTVEASRSGTDVVLRGDAQIVESAGHGRSPTRDVSRPERYRRDPGPRPDDHAGRHHDTDADGRPDPALRHRDLRRGEGSGERSGRNRRRSPCAGPSSVRAAHRPAERGVGRCHADGLRHDRRMGVRPLLVRAAAGVVPGPQAPLRRHVHVAPGEPRQQRCRLCRRGARRPRRRRAGQRGQGVHRRVRRRVGAGLHADARGHRGDVRARSSSVPAAGDSESCAGRHTGGPPRSGSPAFVGAREGTAA